MGQKRNGFLKEYLGPRREACGPYICAIFSSFIAELLLKHFIAAGPCPEPLAAAVGPLLPTRWAPIRNRHVLWALWVLVAVLCWQGCAPPWPAPW